MHKLALGQSAEKSGTALMTDPTSPVERIAVLEAKLAAMTDAFYAAKRDRKREDNLNAYTIPGVKLNKDGIPIGTTLIGMSRGALYTLNIADNGDYYVGTTKYPSLSAAAEAVSGVRRSGWTFWKLVDDRTAKDVFKR